MFLDKPGYRYQQEYFCDDYSIIIQYFDFEINSSYYKYWIYSPLKTYTFKRFDKPIYFKCKEEIENFLILW